MRKQLYDSNQLLQIPSTKKQLATAAIVVAAVLLVTSIVLPNGELPLAEVKPFLPAFIAWFIFGDLLTSHLFFSQFRAGGNISVLILGCAYLFNGLIIIPHILTFPGVFSPTGLLGAGSQSAVWLWVFWHAGFPVGIIAYLIATLLEKKPLQGWKNVIWGGVMTAAVLLLVTAAAWISIKHGDKLPQLIAAGQFRMLVHSGVGPAVWVLNFFALIMLLIIRRGRNVLTLWLTVAVFAFLMDITLTLFSGSRYSLGWYVGRGNSLLSAFVIICAIIYEVNKLYVRLVKQQQQLILTQEELQATNEQLTELSSRDSLTGLLNRRSFEGIIEAKLKETERLQLPFSLLMLDIDCFKQYNDHYGHLQGDIILQKTTRLIGDCLAGTEGIAARYGGEEFAVLLPGYDEIAASAISESIRNQIFWEGIPHSLSTSGPFVTVSIGVATRNPGEKFGRDEIIVRADKALYQSKAQGRNQVTSG